MKRRTFLTAALALGVAGCADLRTAQLAALDS